MIMRVATFAMNNQMIDAALQAQSTMATAQLQEASGIVSSDYAGLGQSAGQVVNLQISVTRSQSYIDAASTADNKIQVAYSTVTSISNLLSNFRTALTAADSASSDPASVTQSAQQMMQEMASLLNTQYGGEYLFGGAQTTSPPVDVSSASYPPLTSMSAASTSYYKGDDQIQSVRVSDSDMVSYGVTADNSAFEQGMRALNYIANNPSPTTADLQQALSLVTGAIDGTSVIQSSLGLSSSTVQNASASQTDFQNFTKGLSSNLTDVNVPQVTAQLSNYQAQLEAAYSAISKIQGLNLASYIH
jgi:flagellar hook-associated protein 3 FlgL